MKWLVLLSAAGLVLSAQTMEISSASASPGERASVVITFHPGKNSNILGLQWETIFSMRQLGIEEGGAVISDAAKAAGKSLTCAGKAAKEPGLYSYACILIGGQNEIPGGPVATLRFRVTAQAHADATPLRVAHVEAVSKDLRRVTLPDAQGAITVKR